MKKKPNRPHKSKPNPKSRSKKQNKVTAVPSNNKPTDINEDEVPKGMRLNKFLAHSGLCSRRKAAELIKEGHVTVNQQIVLEIGYRVVEEDIVHFKGQAVQQVREKVYILLNKPKNVITTLKDENQRRTVIDIVKEKTDMRVYPVGRLDRNTTGLLLLTNDGDFAQKLSHPSFKVSKVYKATLDRALAPQDLERIRNTLQLEDGAAPVVAAEYGHNNKIVGIEIHIGRNRIVRRIFEYLGYKVVKLDRIRYGQLTKKNLPIGKSRFLTKQEIVILKHLS